ncbi:uncharacterized protein NDAI_0A01840 [Naumovozyma dairenensis CBS 421]|uniref:Secreted protein n=1 Tax=Naumovozyma dairenensis (strain ATCC 10597 / BCRC 20456 / CBS 421 / NBRC 0211 / NRRL Y-12639) TaxID=1071378 RepID=G0W3F4_NAUDC|nr:hypothetical protein NDAI_0A01840 [Naumovozyma dairenensis CBS 421]CCD22342.1 hypothetical protein NDAI_0A01840 [Naumovozyma dairenensis CBS 421]
MFFFFLLLFLLLFHGKHSKKPLMGVRHVGRTTGPAGQADGQMGTPDQFQFQFQFLVRGKPERRTNTPLATVLHCLSLCKVEKSLGVGTMTDRPTDPLTDRQTTGLPVCPSARLPACHSVSLSSSIYVHIIKIEKAKKKTVEFRTWRNWEGHQKGKEK